MKSLELHREEFMEQGYTLFPRIIPNAWVQRTREAFHEIAESVEEVRETHKMGGAVFLEKEPELALAAISVPRLLDFAETLIGPYIQLESITYRAPPPVSRREAVERPRGYHRDMFAFFPEEGIYHRPLLFNAIVYLQDLTDENGPLYVLPGSHRRAMGLTDEQRRQTQSGEVAVYPKAGDAVMFHCSLLHSASPNISDERRHIFIITYNHAWLKFRADYNGPACRTIIDRARQRSDRRLLRLLGHDERMFQRANWGYCRPDTEIWKQWSDEDRAALRG